ncbi:MAG: hypothetical protein RLZZ546_1225 [Bacteroidota bacterium]
MINSLIIAIFDSNIHHGMRPFIIILLFFNLSLIFSQNPCACEDNKDKVFSKSKNSICEAEKYLKLGIAYTQSMSFDSGLITLNKALSEYKKSSCYHEQTLVYYYLITAAERKGDFEKAVKLNIEIHELAINNKDYNIGTASYLNIAQIFNRLTQYEKAMLYTRKAIPYSKKEKDDFYRSGLENKIAARYLLFAEKMKNVSYLDTANMYALNALATGKKLNDSTTIIISLSKLSSIDYERKNYKDALQKIEQALQLCKAKNISEKASLYLNKSKIHHAKNDYDIAKIYADSSLLYCQKDKYPPMIAEAYKMIYQIESKRDNYKDALFALQNERIITDSISTKDKSESINSLEQKFMRSENEKNILILKNRNNLFLLGLLALSLFSLGIYFYYKRKTYIQKQRILETEQKLNRARMNPHFFFNALASLQSFAMNESDSISIAENLSKFSHIMRETLENTYREYVTVSQEKEFLNEYLELQQMRFPNKFKYEIQGMSHEEGNQYYIPSMIVQPFVENSIEHGFSNLPYEGILIISFNIKDNGISVNIFDNGKGLNYDAIPAKPYISRASQIIKDRIYLLNLKLKCNAAFSIKNNEENGVNVEIKLPIIPNE